MFLLLILASGCQRGPDNSHASSSLWEILDYYGFTQPDQKRALAFLMKESGALKSNETFQEVFPQREDPSLLFKDILHFVSVTQKYFTIRTGTQERWEIQSPPWIKEHRPEILRALRKLGITEAISPSLHRSDVICILGSTFPNMSARLAYTARLFHAGKLKAKHLVLLAGERKATISIDGKFEQLLAIAKKYNISDLSHLTETHLIQEAYYRSRLFNQLPVTVIDTPAGNLPRPTTETTAQAFCQWLKKHPSWQTVTFISLQPNVKYQEAILRGVFKREKVSATFEVIGDKVDLNQTNLHALIGALGSQIWAKTPEVIAKVHIKTRDQKLIKAFKELYLKQPLIYKNVEALFISGT